MIIPIEFVTILYRSYNMHCIRWFRVDLVESNLSCFVSDSSEDVITHQCSKTPSDFVQFISKTFIADNENKKPRWDICAHQWLESNGTIETKKNANWFFNLFEVGYLNGTSFSKSWNFTFELYHLLFIHWCNTGMIWIFVNWLRKNSLWSHLN